jgi:hypothetical protein
MRFLPHFWVKIRSKMGKMHRLYYKTCASNKPQKYTSFTLNRHSADSLMKNSIFTAIVFMFLLQKLEIILAQVLKNKGPKLSMMINN